jgi:hypothetical protein
MLRAKSGLELQLSQIQKLSEHANPGLPVEVRQQLLFELRQQWERLVLFLGQSGMNTTRAANITHENNPSVRKCMQRIAEIKQILFFNKLLPEFMSIETRNMNDAELVAMQRMQNAREQYAALQVKIPSKSVRAQANWPTDFLDAAEVSALENAFNKAGVNLAIFHPSLGIVKGANEPLVFDTHSDLRHLHAAELQNMWSGFITTLDQPQQAEVDGRLINVHGLIWFDVDNIPYWSGVLTQDSILIPCANEDRIDYYLAVAAEGTKQDKICILKPNHTTIATFKAEIKQEAQKAFDAFIGGVS